MINNNIYNMSYFGRFLNTLITGASTKICESSNVSRIGDIVIGNCGHIGVMVTGSATETSEGSKTVRVGDNFSGCFTGVLVTGASTDDTG